MRSTIFLSLLSSRRKIEFSCRFFPPSRCFRLEYRLWSCHFNLHQCLTNWIHNKLIRIQGSFLSHSKNSPGFQEWYRSVFWWGSSLNYMERLHNITKKFIVQYFSLICQSSWVQLHSCDRFWWFYWFIQVWIFSFHMF